MLGKDLATQMIPFRPDDPHVEAYMEWRKAVRSAKWEPEKRGYWCEVAKYFQMRYETLVAQIVCDFARKMKEKSHEREI
jgi:hypothetical protein